MGSSCYHVTSTLVLTNFTHLLGTRLTESYTVLSNREETLKVCLCVMLASLLQHWQSVGLLSSVIYNIQRQEAYYCLKHPLMFGCLDSVKRFFTWTESKSASLWPLSRGLSSTANALSTRQPSGVWGRYLHHHLELKSWFLHFKTTIKGSIHEETQQS